jgi:hypothetical protein
MQVDVREKGLLMLPPEEAPVLPRFDELLAVPPSLRPEEPADAREPRT